MAAAAQRLHDHLHIHGTHAAGRDVYAVAHLHCHKAGVHALNAQQVVGSLRNGDPGFRGHFAANGDGTIFVHLCLFHQIGLGVVLHHGHIEQPAHPLGLCAVAA